MEPLLTVQEVAALVGLSDSTVRQAISDGELPATRLRRRLRIDPADLAGWVHQARVRPSGTRHVNAAPRAVGDGPATVDNVRDLIAQARSRHR